MERALRGPVVETDHYGSGDRTSLTTGVRDVSHEYDCTYRAGTGAEARVWVFAEPVTRGVARGIVRDVRRHPGLPAGDRRTRLRRTHGQHVVPRRPPPRPGGDAARAVRRRVAVVPGLDAATATAGDPRRETERRAQRWCVSVATSVGARP